MINREKVRLMTKIAMYRNRHERIFRINKYFSYDYVVWNLMLSAVRYTIGALFIFGMLVLLDAELIFYSVGLSGITGTLTEYAVIYLAGLILYLILSAYIYKRRYKQAQKGMLFYNSMLKRLARRFHYNE